MLAVFDQQIARAQAEREPERELRVYAVCHLVEGGLASLGHCRYEIVKVYLHADMPHEYPQLAVGILKRLSV